MINPFFYVFLTENEHNDIFQVYLGEELTKCFVSREFEIKQISKSKLTGWFYKKFFLFIAWSIFMEFPFLNIFEFPIVLTIGICPRLFKFDRRIYHNFQKQILWRIYFLKFEADLKCKLTMVTTAKTAGKEYQEAQKKT